MFNKLHTLFEIKLASLRVQVFQLFYQLIVFELHTVALYDVFMKIQEISDSSDWLTHVRHLFFGKKFI